jgi:U4/U6.U5 tri-snRNP component SNU23
VYIYIYIGMASNLPYRQVANVSRRTWDAETYERKARARESQTAEAVHAPLPDTDAAPEFVPADAGRAGPEGSSHAFLQARRARVEHIDARIGTTELVAPDAAARSSVGGNAGSIRDGVTSTGVGWHCKVCDCFLKDSHTYLDHINGRKHQRNLGFSMRVERSTKDQLRDRLQALTKQKEAAAEPLLATDFDELVKQKDEQVQRRKEERQRKRQQRKHEIPKAPPEPEPEVGNGDEHNVENEEVEEEGIDPALAAMMGFGGFGGGNKTR